MERDIGGSTEVLATPQAEKDFRGATGDLMGQEQAEKLSNTEVQKDLGAMVARSAEAKLTGLDQAEAINLEVAEEMPTFSGIDIEAGMKNTPELRPLAADGSTEGRLGKAAVSLAHEDINLGIVREAEKSSEEFKDNPSKLDDKRNELMVKMLRDEFGRIFADDGNEDDGIKQGGSEMA